MNTYRKALPQLDDRIFLTDSGLETTLIFLQGIELPAFASFVLQGDADGLTKLREYYEEHAKIALRHRTGFIFESHTWRANSDWGRELGYDEQALKEMNLDCIDLMYDIRQEFEMPDCPMVISGCIGPRHDGYNPQVKMTAEDAQRYHQAQVLTFAESKADLVSAITMTYADEAIGIARAAKENSIPVVISFTVETDGTLPDGTSLEDAITSVDKATDHAPAYYMINCAHPDHFKHILDSEATWLNRIRGIRANASRCSHAELDEAEELDSGNPVELAELYRGLREKHRGLSILGGCCGTDLRHIEQIGVQCC